MSKHKKTRKEKIVADYRHQVYILKNKDIPFNAPPVATIVSESTHVSTYALKDVLKTGILTCFIVAAEIILFFLLKRHAILIPNLNY
jgi:hypothetical protein